MCQSQFKIPAREQIHHQYLYSYIDCIGCACARELLETKPIWSLDATCCPHTALLNVVQQNTYSSRLYPKKCTDHMMYSYTRTLYTCIHRHTSPRPDTPWRPHVTKSAANGAMAHAAEPTVPRRTTLCCRDRAAGR